VDIKVKSLLTSEWSESKCNPIHIKDTRLQNFLLRKLFMKDLFNIQFHKITNSAFSMWRCKIYSQNTSFKVNLY